MNLERFFNPRSAAFVGATEDLRKFGGRCFRRMVDFGFAGEIYAVNPKYTELFGRKCVASIADLPETPDHVGIVVPAPHVAGILKECGARGVPFATVYTSGFKEVGTDAGRALEETLREAARAGHVRFMGPNCNGFVSFTHNFCMTTTAALLGPRPPAGSIGVIAQSGGLGQVNVMMRAQELGLGISHQVSCGNQADLDVLDFADFMVSDPNTDVILMVVEAIGDGEKFAAVARRAAEAEKPIAVLKLGRTEAGRQAAASHTGAVTGSDDVHSAAFRQYGVIRVDDCEDLNAVAMMLRQRRWPKSRRAAAVAASGGHSVLFADLGAALGIEWPVLGGATAERLGSLLPAFGTPSNPVDLTAGTTGDVRIYSEALKAVADDDSMDFVVPILTINKAPEVEAAAALVEATEKPAAILWTGRCSDDPALTAAVVAARGVPVFRDAYRCLRTVALAMDYGAFLRAFRAGGGTERPAGADAGAARAALKLSEARSLGERASRQVLAAYGFEPPGGGLAQTAEQAVELARGFAGPAVLKIESPDIQHKTEAGGVRLNLRGDAEIATAFREIVDATEAHDPVARIDGVSVQEMVAPGVEMILGVSCDATFGPVVSVGLGGIHVEVLHDIAHRIAPVGPREAEAMLRELRGFPILEGVRGAEPSDIAALVAAIVRVSWLAHDLKDEIAELDINPLRVMPRGQGVRLLDALIVRAGPVP